MLRKRTLDFGNVAFSLKNGFIFDSSGEEGGDPLEISGTPVTAATEDEAYTGFTVSASGGITPYVYSLVGDWPAGISINSSTGEVSGTPTEAGTFADLSVRVTDDISDTADLDTFTLEVEAAAQAPTNTVAPVISGNRWVDQTLSTTNGTWDDNGSTISGYTYQWKRGGANISGATASTYILVSADAGQNIACEVTATNAVGSTGAASNALSICADVNWSNVVFLSSFDGADGATSAVDVSNSAHSIVFHGDAQLDTAQSKFGGASLLCDGTGDIVACANSSDFLFGSGQFTIEFFVRLNTNTDATILGVYDTNGQRSWSVRTPNSARWHVLTSINGTTGVTTIDVVSSANTGQWYHIAVDRDASNVVRLYKDGTMISSATFGSTLHASTGKLSIGGFTNGGNPSGGYLNGWVDEVRITKGVARYASDSDFTVPSAAYPRP